MAVKRYLVLLLVLLLLASCTSKPKVNADVSLEKELEEILNTLDTKIKNDVEPEKSAENENKNAENVMEANKTAEKVQETPTQETPKTTEENKEDKEEKNELKLEQIPEKVVNEEEKVSFPNLQAVDPDGDSIQYTFSYPLNEKGEWQTKIGDAGEYKVKISASDGKKIVVQEVLIKVMSINKPPVIRPIKKTVTVNEGETVKLEFYVEDSDNKEVQIAYVGWMSAQTYQTTYSDAGTHNVKVIVTDGISTVSEEFEVIVKDVNRAPVFVKGSFE